MEGCLSRRCNLRRGKTTYGFDRRPRHPDDRSRRQDRGAPEGLLAYFAAEEGGVFGYPESAKGKLAKECSTAKKIERHVKRFATGTLELLCLKASPSTKTNVASELGIKALSSTTGSLPSASQGTHAAVVPHPEREAGCFPEDTERVELVRDSSRQRVHLSADDLSLALETLFAMHGILPFDFRDSWCLGGSALLLS